MNTDLKRPSQRGPGPAFAEPDTASERAFPASQDAAMSRSASSATSLKKDGVALKDKAVTRLAAEADSRKGEVSKQLKSVSGALHAAEDELSKKDGDASEWLKSGLHQAVSTIEDLAERVANKDSAELFNEVRSFARENPKTFLAGCAAIGFAAARVFKAGSEDNPQSMTPESIGGRS